jgi:putative ABC transport system permease protein
MITSIAWKNIWRNKTRSLVVIIATILGLFGGIFSVAFMVGMVEQRFEAAINKEISHIQIHHPKFLENSEIQYTIPDPKIISEEIKRISGIKDIAIRSKIPGMISSATTSAGIQIFGIDPQSEKKITSIYKTIADSCGNYFEEERKNQVVISKKLAEKLKVRFHSKIVLRFQDSTGNIIESAFKIVGLFNTYNSMFDEQVVFIKNSDLSNILGMPPPYHEIALILYNGEEVEKIKSELQNRFKYLKVQSWKEIQPELGLMIDIMDKMMLIFLGIILLALAFGIINTMLMAVLERTKELGMLMSIGMNRIKVFRMIMIETVLLTLTGGVIGMIISGIFIKISYSRGIDLSIVAKGMESLGYESIVYPTITADYFIILTLMILITGVLSAIYPARKALKINPAEAIKME